MGIGPTQPAWKAGILPLNYTRAKHSSDNAYKLYQNVFSMSTVCKLFFKKFILFDKSKEKCSNTCYLKRKNIDNIGL